MPTAVSFSQQVRTKPSKTSSTKPEKRKMSSRKSSLRAEAEDKMASAVHAILDGAVQVGSSLSALEENTSAYFWWTTWAVAIILGLFSLNMLVKVRNQLERLNGYQDTFRIMWEEDRQKEKEKERLRKRRGGGGGGGGEEDAELMDDLLDAVGPVPPPGTRDYDDFLDGLRGTVGNY
ncbi:hypothetical protein GGS20DRAFT_446010 [Poronia punctata]|nr:hypothetical protein GGS20DRAFT_446010 [Poronia punctata]